MVLAATEDDDPAFAELKHTVAVDVNQYYFAVAELDTVGFHAHFHAYEVYYPTTSTALAVVRYSTLADPYPLGLYRCADPATHNNTMVVPVKYHYIS